MTEPIACERRAVGDDGFFIRNRDVEALKGAAFQKGTECVLVELDQIVAVVAELGVDLGREAVTELGADQAESLLRRHGVWGR